MNFTILVNSSHTPLHHHYRPVLITSTTRSLLHTRLSSSSSSSSTTQHFLTQKNRFTYGNKLVTTTCISSEIPRENELEKTDSSVSSTKKGEEEREEESGDRSLWNQMKEIVMFAGPATGLWISGPLMSLIDTAVIGQGSSLELAALGPGTVFCDYASYVFMFLSIATSNMVATALAGEDKNEVQHKISMLLFIGLTCGFLMLGFTKFFGTWALSAFAGAKNLHIVPAANTYIQIRGLAWPAILVGWVAQSASLGMKDSWGPLKALAVASAVNGFGAVVLCTFLGYGIAGAAWATMASQVIAACMMIADLNKKGYNAFSVSVPSPDELLSILGLAAPVFIMIISKVAFFVLVIYFATSMGTTTVAAHQVMFQTFLMCTVWGEPLSQTAQSFLPELIYGVNRSLTRAMHDYFCQKINHFELTSDILNSRDVKKQARVLFKSLVLLGLMVGAFLGIAGTSVPWCFPHWFTNDQSVIQEMHSVLIPFFVALSVTPTILSLEGTLLAGKEFKFVGASMSGCFTFGALLLMLLSSKGFGLPGCWLALSGFQWARFFLCLRRLTAPNSIINSEDSGLVQLEKLKSA